MGRVYDRLKTVLIKIIIKPKPFIDCNYMLGVFNNIQKELTSLQDYLKVMLDDKSNPTISKVGTNKTE